MKQGLKVSIAGLFVVGFAGCSQASTPPESALSDTFDELPVSAGAIDRELLIGTWVHSFEEGAIYRPANYKAEWPPSRFRGSFIIRDDGTAAWLVLAPNDGHYSVAARWELRDGNTLVLTATEDTSDVKSGTVRTITIASLTKDKLELTADSPYLHHAK